MGESDMDSRISKADELHRRGFNCAQAVACAYCDLVGVDEREAFRAMEAFGRGMGGMVGTCGAISGAVYLAGLVASDGNVEAPASKRDTYKLSEQIVSAFQEKNGVTSCHELKGIDCDHGMLRSCPGCIEDACEIVERVLFAEEFEG